MPVTDIVTNEQDLTLTLTANFSASVETVWEAFTTPRQLERFWGPPMWPATFTEFTFEVGGKARYHMTGPKNERASGAWEFVEIQPTREFTVLDTFVLDDGTAFENYPATRLIFTFDGGDDFTRLKTVSAFQSVEALEQAVTMGAREGFTEAINQLDAVLVNLRDYAKSRGTQVETLDDTRVRITRLINGPRDLVWRAHNEPDLLKRWLLGPDGWEMTECIVASAPGGSYKYTWSPVGETAGEAFGFEGEAELIDAPHRAVNTERMQGTEGPTTLNDLTFYEQDGLTLLTLIVAYPSAEVRATVLASGMVQGMEASYARLDQLAAG